MALKKTENLIIGFDTQTCVVKILRNVGDNFKNVVIEHFDVDKKLLANKSVFELLNKVLANYTAEHQTKQQDVYIVLPDYFITIDQITLPVMSKAKLKDLLKSQLQKTYPNFAEVEMNITTLSKNKRQITYSVTIVDKAILQDCTSVCKKYNLNLRNVSYSSNCLANSVLALAPKTKHANFLLLDVQEKQSKLIYISHDRTICFGILPFGENFLKNNNSKPFDFIPQTESLKEVFNATETLLQPIGNGSASLEEMEKKAFESFCETYENEQTQRQNFVVNLEKNYSKFSTFISYAITMQNAIETSYSLPKPENLLVNINQKLFDEKIKDFDFDVKIQNLKDELPNECLLNDYLDLFGAIYAGTFNASQNFLDKESKASVGMITTKKQSSKGREKRT